MSNREAGSRIVWVTDEHVFGEMVGGMGAFYTNVKYVKGGMEYEVLMENDEFILLEDFFEYDNDD